MARSEVEYGQYGRVSQVDRMMVTSLSSDYLSLCGRGSVENIRGYSLQKHLNTQHSGQKQ